MRLNRRRLITIATAVLGASLLGANESPVPVDDTGSGALEADVKTDFSRIRIRKNRNVRTMLFVRDNGEEVIESSVNLDKPHDLLIDYTKHMFLSYIVKPKQDRVLIIGLGGGAMIHFMKHHEPKAKVDVVEIDPIVVKLADKYFGVRTEGNVNIAVKDGFQYLKDTPNTYDVIYMDAFLKPSKDTDETGVPLKLKTIRFYKDIQKKLTADGLVVFNINPHAQIQDDVRNIREAFPQTYVFNLPNLGGLVVIGSMAPQRLTLAEINAKAVDLDKRFKASFSFREMANTLGR